MPVSCENSDSAISSTIRDSLVMNYNSITKATNFGLTKNQLSAALKQSLLNKIEYVESPPGFGYSTQDSLKAKYTVFKPSEEEKTGAQSVSGKIKKKFCPKYNGNVMVMANCTTTFCLCSSFIVPFLHTHSHIKFVYVKLLIASKRQC